MVCVENDDYDYGNESSPLSPSDDETPEHDKSLQCPLSQESFQKDLVTSLISFSIVFHNSFLKVPFTSFPCSQAGGEAWQSTR
jgi:hypothetical protein